MGWLGRFGYYAEAAGVVPHGPTEIVLFEGGADVFEPGGAVLGFSGVAEDAEFVADDGNVPVSRPGRDLIEVYIDASEIPAVGTVAHDEKAIVIVGNGCGGGANVVGIGGIRKTFEVVPGIYAPGCALMGEDVRLVKMEIVNDVGVAERLEEDEIVVIGPASAFDEDGVLRGGFANGADETNLNAVPAIAIAHFRFVESFEENFFGIVGAEMFGEGAPEIGELFDGFVAGEFLLEVFVGMDVEDDGEVLVEEHLDSEIDFGQIVSGNLVGLITVEDGSGIDAEADVIEAYGFDEGGVGRRVPGFEMFLGVALGVVDLGEPFAHVDAVTKMLSAGLGEGIVGRGLWLRERNAWRRLRR